MLAAAALAAGCAGELASNIARPGMECTTPACDALGVSSRVARLTHAQWANTVGDLLRLDAKELAATLTGDTNAGSFDTHVDGMRVGASLWADYQRAAELLAARVTEAPQALEPLHPAALPADPAARAAAFVRHVGLRAYRRPLSEAELAQLLSLYAQGPQLTGLADAHLGGARVVLQLLLQSPGFLYRLELSPPAQPGAEVSLDPYEVASRLSYALWNTMPDEALLAAAASGQLSTRDQVRSQARRLLAHERARAVIGHFHAQLFDLDEMGAVVRDPSKFPGVTAALGPSLAKEAALFLDDVAYVRQEGFAALLTGGRAFVNDQLAPLYGLPVQDFGPELQPVELDPAQRPGLLTRAGFLAAFAHGGESDPIRRGVYVNHRVLCAALPPPPDNVPPLPAGGGNTTRERVNAHTGPGTCGATCHGTFINPAGFAFEHFDGVGKYRTDENGYPINAADRYTLPGGEVLTYADAPEFSQALAGSREAHGCYARHWLEFLQGREFTSADRPLVSRLATASLSGASVTDLVVEAVTSATFLTHAEGVSP